MIAPSPVSRTSKRRCAVAAIALALGALVLCRPVLADGGYPVLDIGASDYHLGGTSNLTFHFSNLGRQSDVASITLRTPSGYDLARTHPSGQVLGVAEIEATRAGRTRPVGFAGTLFVNEAARFSSPDAASCAPGTHTATWRLALRGPSGRLIVPIAVDREGTGYRVIVCLGSLRPLALRPDGLSFTIRRLFRNPPRPDLYRFTALVESFDAAGLTDPATAYELQGDVTLPQTLRVTATYSTSGRRLVVKGSLVAAGQGRVDIDVRVYAGTSSDPSRRRVGTVVTGAYGLYILGESLARRPVDVLLSVPQNASPYCMQPSTAPEGCLSETSDGVSSQPTRVTAVP